MGHAVCLVGAYIYVTGGLKELSEVDQGQQAPTPLQTNARYNTISNVWEDIAPLYGKAAKSSATLVLAENWQYQIGGNYGDSNVYRLDVRKPFGAWEKVELQIPGDAQLLACGQIGVLDLHGSDQVYYVKSKNFIVEDKKIVRSTRNMKQMHQFILFGGIDSGEIEQRETAMLSIGEFGCDYERLTDLEQPDRFFSNQAAYLDRHSLEKTDVGFTGRNQFVIWNFIKMNWNEPEVKLGYKRLL